MSCTVPPLIRHVWHPIVQPGKIVLVAGHSCTLVVMVLLPIVDSTSTPPASSSPQPIILRANPDIASEQYEPVITASLHLGCRPVTR